MSAHRNVLLVGSIGLDEAETVFRVLADSLGGLASRYPDGESGPRSNWIAWQQELFARSEQVTPGDTIKTRSGDSVRRIEKYRIVDGVDPGTLSFGSPGYANEALASYESFRRLRDTEVIPPDTRFQVSLPTPTAVVSRFFLNEAQADVEPAYEHAMLQDLDTILATVPHRDLAIQWDVAAEVLAIEGAWEVFYDDLVGETLTRLARLGAFIPKEAELGYHLCYGDPGHKHVKEPNDLGVCVTLANGLGRLIDREIDWIHMPVPRNRNDDAYFAPLRHLKLKPDCELYLGLVHLTDGLDGARQRLEAAERASPFFGIATECGFGRRPAETIPRLLDLHVQIATL